MSSMHKSDTNGPFFGKFRQVEYSGDETRPSLIRDTMLRRTASLNHIDAFSIEHDNEDIDRMHV
ncbi:hypothetical protein [Chitinimonas koreensis]|nr:hypothetical protein [Chitinimonas koreensis]QNM95331.1 hypothetical protein H9L41_15835 [Chitinimonas koreensis]